MPFWLNVKDSGLDFIEEKCPYKVALSLGFAFDNRDEIIDWLEQNATDKDMIATLLNPDACDSIAAEVYFNNPELAMLFRLSWAGLT
jgi:hypothetical protein